LIIKSEQYNRLRNDPFSHAYQMKVQRKTW